MRPEIFLRGPRPSNPAALVCYKGTRGFHGVSDVTVSCLCIRCSGFYLVVHLTGTVAEGAPVIPVSAQLKYNIDVICEYITKRIPIPVRDFSSAPRLIGKDFTSPHLLLLKDFGPFGTRSKHKKVQKNAYLLWHGHTICIFSGKSPLSSHKMTLNSLMGKNNEKWESSLSFLGWSLVACSVLGRLLEVLAVIFFQIFFPLWN